MAFASLTIDLNARLANIEKDLGRSVHLAETSAQRMQAAFAGVGKAFAVLGGGAALAGLGGLVRNAIESADALNDLATRTGTSVRALASMQLAAKLADTDLQSLGAGLGKLSVYMANNADEAARMGVTARDPVEAFAQLADVIGAVEDPAQRNALAMQVLGKSYAELMPLLAQGGDALRQQREAAGPYAERMERLAESAGRFKDAMDELTLIGQAALLPIAQAFTDLASAALDAAEGVEGFDKVLAGLGQAGVVGQTIAVLWANVAFVFQGVGREIGGIAAQLAAIASGDYMGAGAIGDEMKAAAEQARAELQKLEDRILNFQATESKRPAKSPRGGLLNVEDLLGDGENQAGKLQATLRRAFDATPLDDFLRTFAARRQAIVAEYDKMNAELTRGKAGAATGALDLMAELSAGRSSLAGGDAAGAKLAAERGKEMLRSLSDSGVIGAEGSFYVRQLREFELSLVDAEEKTAQATASTLAQTIEQAKTEIAAMEPIAVPLAAEAMANELKAVIATLREELARNPLVVPVQASWGGNAAPASFTQAATAVGAR